jgi:hypothetical protein
VNAIVRKARSIEIHQLGNFQERMLRSLSVAVEDWDQACSALGAWEVEHLTKDNPRSAMKQHQRGVATLLSWGRLLQRATQQPEFPDKTLLARIDARVRHLEDKLAIWHSVLAPSEQERILEAAFERTPNWRSCWRLYRSAMMPLQLSSPLPPRKLKGCYRRFWSVFLQSDAKSFCGLSRTAIALI